MTIIMKDNNSNIKVLVECNADTDTTLNIASQAFKAAFNAFMNSNASIEKAQEPSNVTEIFKTLPKTQNNEQEERPIIRQRIPNNVIDPETLTYKKAMTENALVRCPHCGQSHALVVESPDGMYLMRRNFASNSFDIIDKVPDINNVTRKEGISYTEYFEAMQELKVNSDYADKDIVVNNTSEFICPVCSEQSMFVEWKRAYDQPLDYFETESLCPCCGGEMLTKLTKSNGAKKTVLECKTCGYEAKEI